MIDVLRRTYLGGDVMVIIENSMKGIFKHDGAN